MSTDASDREPPPGISDLPELLCRICSERRLFPEESCADCPFRSAPEAERSAFPAFDGDGAPPRPRRFPSVEEAPPAFEHSEATLPERILGRSEAEVESRLRRRRELAAVWDLIQARYDDEALTLSRVARDCGISAGHLNGLLKHLLELSFHRLLTRYRLLRAARRMGRTDETLVEIAAATGFGHSSSLSRHFKKVVGRPPGAFRSRLRPWK